MGRVIYILYLLYKNVDIFLPNKYTLLQLVRTMPLYRVRLLFLDSTYYPRSFLLLIKVRGLFLSPQLPWLYPFEEGIMSSPPLFSSA